MIAVGSRLPPFDIVDVTGRRFTDATLPARLWIGLFRYASCPLCALRLHEIVSLWPRRYAGRNITFIAVYPASTIELARWVTEKDPPFSIVADVDDQLHDALKPGIALTGAFSATVVRRLFEARSQGFHGGPAPDLKRRFRVPADLIVIDGVVRYAHVGRTFSDHAPFADIDRVLDGVLDGALDGASGGALASQRAERRR